MKLKKKQQITAFEVCLYLFFGVLALLTLYPFLQCTHRLILQYCNKCKVFPILVSPCV